MSDSAERPCYVRTTTVDKKIKVKTNRNIKLQMSEIQETADLEARSASKENEDKMMLNNEMASNGPLFSADSSIFAVRPGVAK